MRRWISLFALSCSFVVASPALADGEMPPLPMLPRTFKSFAECRAFLDAAYKEDRGRADTAPRKTGNGTTQTLIQSEGPKTTGPQQAAYDVTEGWANRTPVPGGKQIMTNYSYKRTQERCDGPRLTGETSTGYSLEGYEPAPVQGK
ncbi:hypothetical protein EWE75_23330 [Sphingomonas populi]|uniref:Uncharacterized protein n=1 Tax=Sphingomonas populi TaxID=2484750 RepID=A0A4Q6XP36_9SPHN|nr:hypothetical protein [Sphingomonas populi]RZF59142.1 hypothetical protein EWE75_23330 [Sphingomonas populi]